MNILYSNIEATRAALGLSPRELPLENVQALDLTTLVELELDVVYPSHAALSVAVEAGTADSQQQKIFNLLKLFCAYQGAVFLLPQLQMLVVQQVSDGDAENRRFSPDDLEVTKDQIRGRLTDIKQKLNPELFTASAFFVNPVIGVQPTFDPVTNEGA